MIYGGSGLWPTNPPPGATGFGVNVNLAFAVDVSQRHSSLHTHFGIMNRNSSGATDTMFYTLNTLYPFVRFQSGTVFFSLGVSPLLWTRESQDWGIDGFSLSKGHIAFLGEIGYEAVITPEISFNLTVSTQWVTGSGGISPRPILDGVASLRLYFGWAGSFEDSLTSREGDSNKGPYKGWRYPYGTPIY
jgi:hypothetical protein